MAKKESPKAKKDLKYYATVIHYSVTDMSSSGSDILGPFETEKELEKAIKKAMGEALYVVRFAITSGTKLTPVEGEEYISEYDGDCDDDFDDDDDLDEDDEEDCI